MAQPFLRAIPDEGEVSTFHFQGRFSHAVTKRPKHGDFRVQEEHGGLIEPCTPDAETLHVAAATRRALDEPPLQARVDLVRLGDGTLALMELVPRHREDDGFGSPIHPRWRRCSSVIGGPPNSAPRALPSGRLGDRNPSSSPW